MIGGYRYAAAVLAVLVVVSLSGWLGYRLAEGTCVERELVIARAYISNQDAAVAAVRREAEDAEARVAQLRQKQSQALSRVEALNHEMAALPRRPDGDFTADELRLLARAHGELFPPGSGSVPDSVQRSPGAEQSSSGLRVSAAALEPLLPGSAR